MLYTRSVTVRGGRDRLRVVTSYVEVELDRIKRGVAESEELQRVNDGLAEFNEWPVTVVGTDSMTVTAGDIKAKVQKLAMHHDIGLVVVDYLGLMSAAKEIRTRTLELGAISSGLLLAAHNLDVPILAIHQLNRGIENRNNKQPQLSDLRGSGWLEEDADVVIMLHQDDDDDESVMQIWIQKNRSGGPSNRLVKMAWRGEFMRVEPLSRQQKPPRCSERYDDDLLHTRTMLSRGDLGPRRSQCTGGR